MHPPPPAGCHNELFAAASPALVSPIFRCQEPFRVNRRRATRARGRDGLPVNVIRSVFDLLNVPARHDQDASTSTR
jgi:hypothetical protein